MGKRVPVYLSQDDLRLILQSLFDLKDQLPSWPISPNIERVKLQERLEAELATFEE